MHPPRSDGKKMERKKERKGRRKKTKIPLAESCILPPSLPSSENAKRKTQNANSSRSPRKLLLSPCTPAARILLVINEISEHGCNCIPPEPCPSARTSASCNSG